MKNGLIYLSELKQTFDTNCLIWTDRFQLNNNDETIFFSSEKLTQEISDVITKILKDFNTLDKVGIACLGKDEFERNGTLFCINDQNYKDLFLNFSNHYIWIRLLPETSDYNIYIKVYKK